MVAIKPLDQIVKKWAEVTPGRSPYYEAGVRSPSKDWQKETLASQSSYEAGVTQAISQKRFGKGVSRAGTAKWQRKASEVGVARYGAGVTAAKEDYSAGFTPYHGVISRVVLPDKGPRGSAQNYARVKAIGDALFRQRTGSGSVTPPAT